MKQQEFASCHTDKLHLAKGLCKSCYNKSYYQINKKTYRERGKIWRDKPENKTKLRNKNLKYYYGISLEEFNKKVEDQNGMCAICKIEIADHLDHSHVSNKIRGILCHSCNTAIGLMKENKITLQNAVRYLDLYE